MITLSLSPPERCKAVLLFLALAVFIVSIVPTSAQGQVGTPEEKQNKDKAKADLRNSGDFEVAPQTYTATAYSLRGRTASGQPVSRGLIAADPSVLPLGTRVRLEAGPYSGDYLVMDTGGIVKGRKIDIWTPSDAEVSRFGSRTVKLTVLAYGHTHSPVMIRQELEKEYQEKRITDAEYQRRYAQWATVADETVKTSAHYYADRPRLFKSAIYMPAKFSPVDPNEKTLLDTQHERFRLQVDLIGNKVSPAEYAEKLFAIVAEENVIARKGALTPSEVAHYYQTTAKIQPMLAALQTRNWETAVKVGMILAAILGIALPFYLGYKKDRREKSTLELEKRKVALAEVGALFQVEEMKLKIAQLEQQVAHSGTRLIVP